MFSGKISITANSSQAAAAALVEYSEFIDMRQIKPGETKTLIIKAQSKKFGIVDIKFECKEIPITEMEERLKTGQNPE